MGVHMMDTDIDVRRVASEWHGGQWSALYAFSSSGTIQNYYLESEIEACMKLVKASPASYDPGAGDELRSLLEYVTQPITSVWSSHGHTFIDAGSCLTCGGEWELVRDDPADPSHGAYQASNGDEATACTHDTSMEHGDPRETGHSLDCEDGCEHCKHECNCVTCTG